MTTWFVSRHEGALDWITQQGFDVDAQVSHMDVERVERGDVVIGSLPVNLAARICERGGRYVHLVLDLSFEVRGKELDVKNMMKFGARLEEFRVTRVGERS